MIQWQGRRKHVNISGQNRESEKYISVLLEVTGICSIQHSYADFSCYLPAGWLRFFTTQSKKIWLAIKQNFSTCITSPGGSIGFISPYLTQIAHPFPSPTKTLVGQSECSHCEALDTLQLLVKLTHVWSLRWKCQHIERRNYVTPPKKSWIVGKRRIFFLAGLILCLPQNTSGGGEIEKTEEKNIHTCFSFVNLLGPPFWDGDRKVGKVVCRSYQIPMGFREVFVTLHLIAKQKFNHPCRW